jgi:tRNA(Glu) U13 pseudouridine synthase TruD
VKDNFENCFEVKANAGELYCTDTYFEKKFPLPGHDFKDEILKADGIKMQDFKVKEISYLSSRTTYRDACIKLDVKLSALENDELNKGKKKQAVSFSLPSGSYATFAIKCMARD